MSGFDIFCGLLLILFIVFVCWVLKEIGFGINFRIGTKNSAIEIYIGERN